MIKYVYCITSVENLLPEFEVEAKLIHFTTSFLPLNWKFNICHIKLVALHVVIGIFKINLKHN